MSYIYLASPYSHPLKSVQFSRYQAAIDAVALIHRNQVPVYSPIVHWHQVGKVHDLPGDHEYWLVQDRPMMEACLECWVLAIPGWYESVGVQSEIKFLRERQKTVRTFNFEYLPQACALWRVTYRGQEAKKDAGPTEGAPLLVSAEQGGVLP